MIRAIRTLFRWSLCCGNVLSNPPGIAAFAKGEEYNRNRMAEKPREPWFWQREWLPNTDRATCISSHRRDKTGRATIGRVTFSPKRTPNSVPVAVFSAPQERSRVPSRPISRHPRPSGPTLSSRLLWETNRGTVTPVRAISSLATRRRMGLCDLVLEYDQHRGLHAVIVGGAMG